MVKTNSVFLNLGTNLPKSQMINVNSHTSEIFDFAALDEKKHLLIMFICAHCPFVKFVEKEISKINYDFKDNVQTIAISSNDIETHPSDSPENLRIQAEENGWKFPYLFDKDQSFAKNLKAACTPDFYLFSQKSEQNFTLFYHGQLDSSRPSNDIPTDGNDLRLAIKALINSQIYSQDQIPSLGCNIKWTPGAEPDWFK